MTWSETHRRWQALAEIEALVNATDTDELPWTPAYAAIFGDRDSLAAALRHRWMQTRDAQLDSHLAEDVFEVQRRRLLDRNAGVLRVLQAWEASRGTVVRTLAPPRRSGAATDAVPA